MSPSKGWPIRNNIRFKRKKDNKPQRNLTVTIIILWEKARTQFYCRGYSTFLPCVMGFSIYLYNITLNY